MNYDKLRAWWFHKQGLDGTLAAEPPAAVLDRSGWARSVGGSGPYLALFARAGTSRDKTDSAAATLQIHELPSARGCTYVLPSNDFALGLTVAQGFGDDAQIATAKKFLGVTEEEIQTLSQGVLEALRAKPLDPTGLKNALGDLVRNLGEEGKKRGSTNTLPLALGTLQTTGRIRRIPTNGRLDQQKYQYTLWANSPMDGAGIARDNAFQQFASRYFRWTGPATLANFQWFSGLGVKAAKDAVGYLDLVPIEAGSDRLIFKDELESFQLFERPDEPQYALVSSIDSISLLRRDYLSVLDESDTSKLIDSKGLVVSGAISEMSCNMILDRGRVVGLWEYDPEAKQLVWATFEPQSKELQAKIDAMESFIRDQLGDARSFSLDSPESRKPRLEALRNPPWHR